MPDACRCGSTRAFSLCCEPLLTAAMTAPTAERLMRSRFTAYALGDAEYVLRTWHPDTRPTSLDLSDGRTWTDLDVLGATGGGMLHTTGTVDFVARYRDRGRRRAVRVGEMRESSSFVRVGGAWMYVEAL